MVDIATHYDGPLRTQPQHESLDSDSNHDTLPTYVNPTANTLCFNPSLGSLVLFILYHITTEVRFHPFSYMECHTGCAFPQPPRTKPTLPHKRFYVFVIYVLQDRARQSMCAPGAGFNSVEFCRLVAYLCRDVSLFSSNSQVRLVCPSAAAWGPA